MQGLILNTTLLARGKIETTKGSPHGKCSKRRDAEMVILIQTTAAGAWGLSEPTPLQKGGLNPLQRTVVKIA